MTTTSYINLLVRSFILEEGFIVYCWISCKIIKLVALQLHFDPFVVTILYKETQTADFGEELCTEREFGNIVGCFVVVVKKTLPPNFLEIFLVAAVAPIMQSSLPISACCFTE